MGTRETESDECKQEVRRGLAMHDICMLVSEECTERLVNNPLCSGSACFSCCCCSLPICFCALSHRNWGNMDYCIIMRYL